MARSLMLLGALVLLGCGGAGGPSPTIRGTARLPDCTDAPAFDLDGTRWFDTGTVKITSMGCALGPNEARAACPTSWGLAQSGHEVTLDVDEEYRLLGRACGSELHLEGGWWLTVENEDQRCDYDDGVEVRVQEGGATLYVSQAQNTLTGTLHLAATCTATYAVTFLRSGAQ